jgi:hypothetical protein
VFLSGAMPNLCTGIVKLENSELIVNQDKDWFYIATWGKQSLANDNLGMAVLFERSKVLEITEDKDSHVAVLKPTENQLTYYFLAAWEQEPNGIKTKEAFIKYLDEITSILSAPLVLRF